MAKLSAATLSAVHLHQPGRAAPPVSPLVLCDHLIQVAQEADRAGYSRTAADLIVLVNRMFDVPAQRH